MLKLQMLIQRDEFPLNDLFAFYNGFIAGFANKVDQVKLMLVVIEVAKTL